MCSAEVDRLNEAYTETLDNHGVEIILERATVDRPARGHAGERPRR